MRKSIKFLIGILLMIVLLYGLLSCKRENLNTTTTNNTTTDTKYSDSTIAILGSHVKKLLNKGFDKDMEIGKIYTYFDSLHQTQLQFIKDSLGNVQTDCITNNRKYTYTYPTIHTHTESTTIKEVPVKTHIEKLPFWAKLLIGGQTIIILLLVIKLLFK